MLLLAIPTYCRSMNLISLALCSLTYPTLTLVPVADTAAAQLKFSYTHPLEERIRRSFCVGGGQWSKARKLLLDDTLQSINVLRV